MAADHLGELHVVAHRGRDQDLAAFVVIGDDGGHVGNIAAVVLEVKAAGADDTLGESNAHGRDQVGELVDEQVGVHAAAEIPVTAPLGVASAVKRLIGGQAEVGPEEHLPVDGLGGHVLARAHNSATGRRRCCGSSWSGPA